MKIGIVGTGNVGGALTRLFRAAGHEVTVANSRGPESLADLSAATGARAEFCRLGDVPQRVGHLFADEAGVCC